MTITPDYQRDWPRYFEAVASQGARDTLLRAFDAWGPADPTNPPLAMDVACGEGRDTRELLSRGWRVFAFDASALGISKLLGSAPPQMQARLTATELRFEDVLLSPALPASVDLVNASFALPFCPPPVFPGVWKRLTGVLNRGGLFAGQIFGDRDEWAKVRPESHFTRTAMEALFGGFEFVHLEEVEKDGADALAGMKHHHLFHIVARKLGAVAGH